MTTFAAVLEAVDELPLDAQEELVDIVNHRIHEMKRKEIVDAVKESRREFNEGKAKVGTPDQIVDEMFS